MRWQVVGLAFGLGAACCGAPAATDAERAIDRLAADDCEGALVPLNLGVKAGDPRAYTITGMLLSKGVCVLADVKRAMPFLEIAARHGDAAAAEYLVVVHGLGRGVSQNFAEAGRWAVALLEVHAASGVATGAIRADAKQLDAADAAAFGRAATIHARARELFEPSWQVDALAKSDFSVIVTVTKEWELTFELRDRSSGGQVLRSERRRLIDAQLEQVRGAYQTAFAEVGPHQDVMRTPTTREYAFKYQ